MSYKIDSDVVRETYAVMGDSEILDFAKTEGLGLTSEAFLLLRDELTKRNIGADIIASLEHEIILRYGLRAKNLEEDFNKDLFAKGWDYAFKMKIKGLSNYEIHKGLQEIGFNSEYAYYVIGNLKEKSISLIEDSKMEAISGIAIAVIGGFLVYVSFRIERFEAPAILLLLGGFVRVFVSLVRKDKFEKLINNIDSELEQEE
jgi:hypothetical protein